MIAAIWAALPKSLKLAAAAGLIAFGAYQLGGWHGRQIATAEAEARGAQATISQLKERGLINEAVRNVDDCALIRELGGVCDNPQP